MPSTRKGSKSKRSGVPRSSSQSRCINKDKRMKQINTQDKEIPDIIMGDAPADSTDKTSPRARNSSARRSSDINMDDALSLSDSNKSDKDLSYSDASADKDGDAKMSATQSDLNSDNSSMNSDIDRHINNTATPARTDPSSSNASKPSSPKDKNVVTLEIFLDDPDAQQSITNAAKGDEGSVTYLRTAPSVPKPKKMNNLQRYFIKSFEILSSDSSVTSSVTQRKTTKSLHRLYLTINVSNQKDVKAASRFTHAFNQYLEVLREAEPNAKLVPWALTDPSNTRNWTKDIADRESMYRKYFYTGKDNPPITNTVGKKWLRIQVAVPTEVDLTDTFDKMRNYSSFEWWDDKNNFCKVTACQAIDPVVIGWFMRSFEIIIELSELQDVLRVLTGDHSLGLEWKIIDKDTKGGLVNKNLRTPKSPVAASEKQAPLVRAIHVECERKMMEKVIRVIDTIYRKRDYPLGISMAFVKAPTVDGMQTAAARKGTVKCVFHHYRFGMLISSTTVEVEHMDKSLPAPNHTKSLRRYLCELTVQNTSECVGDRLFLGIVRISSTEYCFVYHDIVADEAYAVAQNTILILRDELKADPSDYFDMGSVMDKRAWKWNPNTRVATDPDGDMFDGILAGDDDQRLNEDEDYLAFAGTAGVTKKLSDLDDLDYLQYRRLNGHCDETVVRGVDNTAARIKQLKGLNGTMKTILAGPSANASTTGSQVSNLTDPSGATRESTRVAWAERARKETAAQYEGLMKQQKEESDAKVATLEGQLSGMIARQQALERLLMAQFPAAIGALTTNDSSPASPAAPQASASSPSTNSASHRPAVTPHADRNQNNSSSHRDSTNESGSDSQNGAAAL